MPSVNNTSRWPWLLILCSLVCLAAPAQDRPQVVLSSEQVGPRALESLTGQAIIRDYGRAWNNMAVALDSSSPDLLNGYFAGTAKTWLNQAVADQKKTGVHVRYLHQQHQL